MADIDLTIESQATAPVEMEVSAGQVIPAPVDDTLTIRGMAADAKAALAEEERNQEVTLELLTKGRCLDD